ncbi:DUF3862 domain-containing protein [Leuconostoc citreum]|uniref:DUF3862 domain-containing protein n=1 Tax=Leuconostoc citreum TaxID=33964 RepID=UPI0032DFD992
MAKQNNSKSKPFYKRVWFWIIVVLVILVLGNLGSKKNDAKSSASKDSVSKVDKKESSSNSNSSAKTENKIQKWSQTDYDSLAKGDIMNNGSGGANMDDIVNKFGKPSSSSDSSVNNMNTRTSIWTNTNGGITANVTLSFVKQDNGTYLLYSAAATGLK